MKLRMKKYCMEVKETYRCYIDVEAKDEQEANQIVERKLENGEIDVLAQFRHADREISVFRCKE